MEEKYHHVTEHIPEIDEMLNRTSEGWKKRPVWEK